MYDLDSVHSAAAEFLKELEKGNGFYREEKIEVAPLAVTNLVVLKQAATPPYFYGFKPSGRPVFTHELKLARAFEATCYTLVECAQKLKLFGHEVLPHTTVWIEGRNVNER